MLHYQKPSLTCGRSANRQHAGRLYALLWYAMCLSLAVSWWLLNCAGRFGRGVSRSRLHHFPRLWTLAPSSNRQSPNDVGGIHRGVLTFRPTIVALGAFHSPCHGGGPGPAQRGETSGR